MVMNRILTVIVFFLLFLLINVYIYNFSFPNTYISQINVTGKNKTDLTQSIKNIATGTLQLQIKDRVYQYRFSDLGIHLNTDSTIKAVFQPNRVFLSNYLSFFNSFRSPRIIIPTITFAEDYYQFIENTVFDFSQKNDQVIIDETNKKINYEENEEKYRINSDSLKSQILFNIGQKNPLKPNIVKIANTKKAQILSINNRLEAIFQKPVYIVVKDQSENTNITIHPLELKKIVNFDIEDSQNLRINIDETELINFINKNVTQTNDKKISFDSLKRDFSALIKSRSNGVEINTLITRIDLNPNSTGNLAKKYIEIDISQQMMYLFENNSLYQTHRVSTGLYYPTPVGQFKILNKAANAFSDIYYVYMPYWMAFGYSSELNAYFGIHELPYWLANNGQRIQRPREFIGSPHTGGCVALDVGSSLEVYNFSDVGMPVYIFN